MSGMLASVCDLEETQLVLDAGVDIIDLKNPKQGALGALDLPLVEDIVTLVNGILPVSATIGDLPFKAEIIGPYIRRLSLTGVDIIKVGAFGEINQDPELKLLSSLSQEGIRMVLVVFAEDYSGTAEINEVMSTGIAGMMLDTRDKNSGCLRDKISDTRLRNFVSYLKQHGLMSGLAGSLGLKDIEALLDMEPDYLGFRGGICVQGQRGWVVDGQALREIRQGIPGRHSNTPHIPAII